MRTNQTLQPCAPTSTLRASSRCLGATWLPAVALALCLASLPAGSRAQESTDPYKKAAPTPAKADAQAVAHPSPHQIFATVEWIEMDAKEALTLIRKGLPPVSPELVEAIRKQADAGSGRVLNTISCVTRSGQRCSIESTREQNHPTEFKETSQKNLSTLDLSGIQSKDPRFAFIQEPSTTAMPSAFDMRPVGTMCELEPVVSEDGRTIDINMAPEMVRYAGTMEYGKASMGGQLVALAEQPVFISTKLSTAVTLSSGQTAVIGMNTPVKDDGTVDSAKRVFILLHAVAFTEATP